MKNRRAESWKIEAMRESKAVDCAPTIAEQFAPLAEEAVKQKRNPSAVSGSAAERRRWKSGNGVRWRGGCKDAHLPRVKTLEEFDFAQAPQISGDPDPGTGRGRLHRAQRNQWCCSANAGPARRIWQPALCVAACRQKTASALHHGGRHWSTSWWKPSSRIQLSRVARPLEALRTDRHRRSGLRAAGGRRAPSCCSR